MSDKMVLAKQHRFRLGNAAAKGGLPYTDGAFYEVYVAHVLHMFTLPELEHVVLPEIRRVMAPGGLLRVVDVDIIKAYRAWQLGDESWYPMPAEDTLDGKLCRYLTWHSTRRTLFTGPYMTRLLERSDRFTGVVPYSAGECPLDQRPSESFFLTARAR
jgi:ubiquinone/menaquinone biosynthesis C-methylase UbiE